MSSLQPRVLASMFHAISEAIEDEKDRLSELDGAVGDADHGITMSIGFLAVNAALSKLDLDACTPTEVLTTAANAFLNAVGASTGPLYATAFLRAGAALGNRNHLDPACLYALLDAIAAGIAERGKARRGDKTMLDAWLPAVEAAHAACEQGLSLEQALAEVTRSAENGAESTRSMVASKGRAVRLGERSIGHIDPGAASAAIIIGAMKKSFSETADPGRLDASLHEVR